MSQIDQCCCYKDPGNDESLEDECQVRLYSPHPVLKVVMISGKSLLCDRSACMNPPRMLRLANQTVSAFNLDPTQVVWIEHIFSDSPFYANFHLIHFDWKAGQATSSHRSPISDDWYLSWLNAEQVHNQLKLII